MVGGGEGALATLGARSELLGSILLTMKRRPTLVLPRVLLLVGVVALTSAPLAHALFGLRGSGSEPPAAASVGGTGAAASDSPPLSSHDTAVGADASPAPAAGTIQAGPQKASDPTDPYPFPPALEDLQDYEAWEDEKGDLHIIRADRLPSGDFVFPEGTTVRRHASSHNLLWHLAQVDQR